MWPLPFTINIKKPLDESQVCLLLLPYSLALTTTALASPREAIGWWREGGREGGRPRGKSQKRRRGEKREKGLVSTLSHSLHHLSITSHQRRPPPPRRRRLSCLVPSVCLQQQEADSLFSPTTAQWARHISLYTASITSLFHFDASAFVVHWR